MAGIRCVGAPIEFEEILLSSHAANDELFERERTLLTIRRNVMNHQRFVHETRSPHLGNLGSPNPTDIDDE